MSGPARHEGADVALVAIERSDAIDAAGALLQLARSTRVEARSRRNAGPQLAGYRAGLRDSARVYEAAARRIQRAADAS